MTTRESRAYRRLVRRIERLRGSIAVIQTWATFRGGETLNAYDVDDLCKRTLQRDNDVAYRDQTHVL